MLTSNFVSFLLLVAFATLLPPYSEARLIKRRSVEDNDVSAEPAYDLLDEAERKTKDEIPVNDWRLREFDEDAMKHEDEEIEAKKEEIPTIAAEDYSDEEEKEIFKELDVVGNEEIKKEIIKEEIAEEIEEEIKREIIVEEIEDELKKLDDEESEEKHKHDEEAVDEEEPIKHPVAYEEGFEDEVKILIPVEKPEVKNEKPLRWWERARDAIKKFFG